MNHAKLTDRQRLVLEVVDDWVIATGHAPSVREVKAAIGVASQTAVLKHADALGKKGMLSRDVATARSFVVTQEGHKMIACTERQRDVLRAIDKLWRIKSYAPSVRELGETLGINQPYGVIKHIAALRRQGLVATEPSVPRSLTLTEAGRRLL